MIRCRLLALVLVLPGLAGWVAAGPDKLGQVRSLDLPSGGRGAEEGDEDLPETIIFYGQAYEGDGFFWCLDRSGSMRANNRMEILKQEVTHAVRNLSNNAHFGLVAFSTNVTPFARMPKQATGGSKSAAIAWIHGLSPDGLTCTGAAGVEILQIAQRCPKKQKVVIVISDGRPSCGSAGNTTPQALAAITMANYQRTPINTLLLGNVPGGMEFMRELAQLNNGSFAHLDSN